MERAPQGVADVLCDEVREYVRKHAACVEEFLETGRNTSHLRPDKTKLSIGAQRRLADYYRRIAQQLWAEGKFEFIRKSEERGRTKARASNARR